MTETNDEAGFLRLLEEHKGILYKAANAYCRNPEDRLDLVQEMVIQLWKSYPRYDDRLRFSTWMYRVAMNVAISFLRSTTRRDRDTVSIDHPDIIDFAAADRSMSGAGDDYFVLQQLIGQLDAMSRALIVLYLDGHSQNEIAEILGISPTNAGTRIARVKQKLQRSFDERANRPGETR
ncbi:MAG: RNA polymerase sigma factor [Thermoanaerobaculia bacterium]|jgi:RNA polymerase sigma-70 factor (ECF subfamily)